MIFAEFVMLILGGVVVVFAGGTYVFGGLSNRQKLKQQARCDLKTALEQNNVAALDNWLVLYHDVASTKQKEQVINRRHTLYVDKNM
jgi:hypothetical protein